MLKASLTLVCLLICNVIADAAGDELPASSGVMVFQQRPIPDGVPLKGHGKDATHYGYRIPSLLTTAKGSILAFAERRLGLHDHAQNDIVLKRSNDGGKTWGNEIVAAEDGMNSLNNPYSVQLGDGRIMLLFVRNPYGVHTRNSNVARMADLGTEDKKNNLLCYVTYSSDDGLTWTNPRNISKDLKHPNMVNAAGPGALITLQKGPHKGRVTGSFWGSIPNEDKTSRTFAIFVAYTDDAGLSWTRTPPLTNEGKGSPNECQMAEASNGDLVILSRNQGGNLYRKKSISKDHGVTWSPLKEDRTLPSVACMGSVSAGPVKSDGSWNLYASFPSATGRNNGQLAISMDSGKSFQINKIVSGSFAYSATQISPDAKSLLCLYETDGYKSIRFISISLSELQNDQAQ